MTVRISTLDNGLRVVTDSMETVESVSLGVWVDVGTRHETPDLNGVSHFLEHMAFKGTKKRNALQISEEIENVGGFLNASTSRETTAYYAKVLKDDIGLALDIISDITQNATLDEEELERERAVILQEISQAHDTPDDIVFDHYQETAYPNQPLGYAILGTNDLVSNLTRDQIKAYMDDHYSAPNMILSAAGNLDHDQLVDQANDAFQHLKNEAHTTMAPARYIGGDFRQARDLEQVHLLLGLEGLPITDEDFYALSVLTSLFGGGMSSRLFQEIREKRGMVYSIFADVSCYQDGGLFSVYAGTGAETVAELTPLICDEFKKLLDGVSEEETHRARQQLKSSMLMSLESTSSRTGQIARQLAVFGKPLDTGDIVAKVNAVTTDDIQRVAARIVKGLPTFATLGAVDSVTDFDKVAKNFS